MSIFDKSRLNRYARDQSDKTRYGLLLVDDELANLHALATYLEEDFIVNTAASGMDALRILEDGDRRQSIQVVITDERMPGMSGNELLSHVRALDPTMQSIIVTGFADVDVLIKAINESQLFHFLQKPVRDLKAARIIVQQAAANCQLKRDNQKLIDGLHRAVHDITMHDAEKLRFLRYLSHEMNTPLNWLSATQAIDLDQLPADIQPLMSCVEQGQQRLKALLATVLRYFEVADRHLEFKVAEVNIDIMLQELLAFWSPRYPATRVVSHLGLADNIHTDGLLLREALGHLIANAFGFSSRDPQVSISSQKEGSNSISIMVEDNGRGMPVEQLGEIFRPFFLSGSAHREEGFGLSLATAERIIVALGGHIVVQSNGPNCGSRFCVMLPVQNIL